MIPTTFTAWKKCIEIDCRINLSKSFAIKRLEILQNKNHNETQQFLKLYGENHLNNIISWYQQIL